MPLTDLQLKKAKSTNKAYRLSDARSLYVLIQPDGAKWWRWDYRRPGTGKRNTLSLGTYPDVSLGDARDRCDVARKQLAAGIDPGVQRQATKAASAERAGNSFEVVAREWYAKAHRNSAPSHAKRVLAQFENDLFPYLGARPIDAITAPELLYTINRIVDRGAVETGHRTLQNVGQVFRYANQTGRTERNPAANLKGALPKVKETHHAAITDPIALGGLLRALDGYKGTEIVRSALKLQILTFVRPGELRQAEWAEIDLDTAEWNIPAARMKMGEPHLVPLATQAVAILRALQPLTGQGHYVFPQPGKTHRPLSDNGMLSALRRMDFGKDEVSGHGFRATARTLLDETLHFPVDHIEHQLAHAVRDPNGRAYNRTKFLAERRTMMQAWADYLDQLRKQADNVAPFVAQRIAG